MSFSVSYIYQVLDKYSAPLSRIGRATDRYKKRVKQAERAVCSMQARMEKAKKSTDRLSGAMAGFGGAAALASVFNMSSRLEDSLGDVQRVMDFTGTNTIQAFRGDLEKMALQLGRTTPTLANMAYEAGKLGITGRKDILAFVGLTAKMADAFDMSGEEASNSLGQIRDMLKLPLPQLKTLADSVNYLADSTSASGAQMINIIRRASGTFGLLEMKPQSVAGWAAFADIIEVSPELAASGLNRMFAQMVNIKGLGKQMMKAPNQTVTALLQKLKQMDKVARAAAAEELFGAETARFVLKAVNNIDKLNDTLTKAGSNKAMGSVQREFDNLTQRSSFMARQIGIVFGNVMTAIGDNVKEAVVFAAPYIIKMAKYVKKFVENNPAIVKAGLAFTAILSAVTLVLLAMGPLTAVWTGFTLIMAAAAATMGVVMTAIGLLISPITLATAAIIGLVYWLSRPGKLKEIWNNLKDAMAKVWHVGVKVWEIMQKVFSGDFKGAWKSSLEAIRGVLGKIKDELKSIDAFFDLITGKKEKRKTYKQLKSGVERIMKGGVSLPQQPLAFGGQIQRDELMASRNVSVNNRMELGGQIRVEALPGTRVDRATINLNTGQNMAYA